MGEMMNQCEKNGMEIDFVIPWVDDRDPVWRRKKEAYTGLQGKEGNTEVRYRDWDTLKYWFRGVEKFAPWVRYVYFVTDDQKPQWLNLDHPKLRWVKHADFIPAEYLPTFSANPIEWNLHRIPGLSENFVYFNDDVFLIRETKPEDFFVDGKPCDLPCLGPIYPGDFFSYMMFNNTELLNRYFSLDEVLKKNRKKWIQKQPIQGLVKLLWYGRRNQIPGSISWHIQTSFQKKTFALLWEKEPEWIHQTCLNRLRTKQDITSYCVRDWQLLSGNFYPKRPIGKLFHTETMRYNDAAVQYLRKQKGKVICLNDTENEADFELHKAILIGEFEKLLPEKSSFEL